MFFRAFIFLAVFCVSSVFAQDGDDLSVAQPPVGSVIRGRAFFQDTGRPIRRGSVMLMGSGGGGGRELTGVTDNEGFFQIKNVPAGKYYPIVNAPGVVSIFAFADLSRPRDEGIAEAMVHFDPINVDGISSIDINVSAIRGGAVSGRVMYADGDAAVGVRVEVLRKTDEKFSTVVPNLSAIFSALSGGGSYMTDDRGYFRAAGLPAGQYVIRVTEKSIHGESAGYRSMEMQLFGGSSLLNVYYPDVFEIAKAQVVELNLGQENPELTITIPDRTLHKISGQVVSAKGKVPFKNARVSIKRKDDPVKSLFDNLDRTPIQVITDEKGNWSFEQLPKGTYEVRAETMNASVLDEKTGVYDGGSYSYGSNTNTASRTPVAKKPEINFSRKLMEITIDDKDLQDVSIELAPGGSIFGSVSYERTKELSGGVSLKLVDENEEEIASTDSWFYGRGGETGKGNFMTQDFTLAKVPADKFFLRVTVSNDEFYVKSAMLKGTDLLTDPVELTEGQILRDLQIVLASDTGTIKGIVTDEDRAPVRGAALVLVPTDPAKRKNPALQKRATATSDGEFEIKTAPGEYVIILKETLGSKKGEELAKTLDEAIKNAAKVKVEPNGTHKVSIKKEKT